MNRILSLLLVFSMTIISYAQNTISGVIKNGKGETVPSASVTIEEPGKDAILAYGISNAKGEYKLTFSSGESTLNLKIKAFNYKTLNQSVKNATQTLTFTINSEVTEIQEVKLKAKIITQRGDTITYDLKAFDNKSDRSLADVLKKMPGFEVNTDGTILYQGKALSKFYVEGKDLMEGGYGTISNSLPKDAVSKVEVLENHQPVSVLRDKIPSDQAAINIKLKKSVTMTGRGEVGAGFYDSALWNVKLTPMFFSKKMQWVLNYKTNNTGEAVENEGNMLGSFSRWEGRRSQANQNKWLGVENASTPNLPEKRYLMNNVHYLSGNILLNPFKNKEWELKANANYTNNAVERESTTETKNFQFNQNYLTSFKNNFYTDKLKGELIFTKNAKKGFFKNTTSFTQYWNADRGDAFRSDAVDGPRSAQQALESPTTAFQNSLSTIIPWKEKLVNLTSYINYQDDKQNLDIHSADYPKIKVWNPLSLSYVNFNFGTNTDWLRQNFRIKSLDINHSANISFTKKYWTFTPEVGFNYGSNKMTSELLNISNTGNISSFGNNFINNLKFDNAKPYASLGINYKNENWMLFANAPFNFNNIKATDTDRGVDKSLNKLTFEPSIFAQYKFASYWTSSVNGGINYSFGDVDDMYSGTILQRPNSLNQMPNYAPINENQNQYTGTRIEYRNPLNNIFFNAGYNYNRSLRNMISNVINTGTGPGIVEYIALDNENNSNTISAEIGKYFPKVKTNASVSFSNSLSKSQQMRLGTLTDTDSNSQRLGFKFNNAYFSWLSVDYNMNYRWSEQSIYNGGKNKNTGYNHNLGVFVYPLENHTIGFNWDQINSKAETQKFNNAFYDLSYQYTWASKKVDFELKWQNIANTKVFEQYSISAFEETVTRMTLRPSTFLFTVKFNFK